MEINIGDGNNWWIIARPTSENINIYGPFESYIRAYDYGVGWETDWGIDSSKWGIADSLCIRIEEVTDE